MTLEEMTRKERERQEKKLRKQLDKQQKVNIDNIIILNNDNHDGTTMLQLCLSQKLAQKGIHVDIATLKREYLAQRGIISKVFVYVFAFVFVL